MNILSRLSVNKILIFFIIIHALLINVNFAEWGDSYRILRASEFLREFSYPADEKRPPLYSIVLAFRPEMVDQVLWARLVIFAISVGTFLVFERLLRLLKVSDSVQKLSLLFLTLNPVFLYWSLRVMADVFFALLVVVAFYFYYMSRSGRKSVMYGLLTGFVSGLAVLTRFEGYLLGFSIGLGYILMLGRDSHSRIKGIKTFLAYGLSALVVMAPWLIYRNPITSSYFEEPSGRAYDIKMLIIFIVSLLFMFGLSQAFYFIYREKSKAVAFFKDHSALAIFIVLEMILILFWPAAIPRLFIPVIPFLIIPLSVGTVGYFESSKKENTALLFMTILTVFYPVIQYYLKLQFLVVDKMHFLIIVLLQFVILITLYFKKFRLFLLAVVVSMLFWSISTIFLHRNIFKPVVQANQYIAMNLEGVVVYNDVSSVSDWYLNQKSAKDFVEGKYHNMDDRKGRSLKLLQQLGADYVLITNEHNADLSFNIEETPYLEQMQEFSYTIKSKKFFTIVAKVVGEK